MSHVPYASAVDNLMYAMVYTKPYISHAVGLLSRFMSKPRKEHCAKVKRVFRYFIGTNNYVMCYKGRLGLENILSLLM